MNWINAFVGWSVLIAIVSGSTILWTVMNWPDGPDESSGTPWRFVVLAYAIPLFLLSFTGVLLWAE